MELSARPAVHWDTARTDEAQNLLVNLMAHEPTAHLVIIPRDVMDGVWGADCDPIQSVQANQRQVETAITRAWNPDRLKLVVGVGHPGRVVQLWLEPADFG